MRKGFVLFTLLLFIVTVVLVITNDSMGDLRKKGDKGRSLAKPTVISRPLWTPNRIADYITNNGQLVSHIPTGSSGMEWPAGSHNTINFASGVWVAGKKAGEIVVAAGEYSVEYQPGKILPSGAADDPLLPKYRVYIIGDDTTSTDYNEWPYDDGAPFVIRSDGKRVPSLIGNSTTWCVFNDLDATLHARLLATKVMGIEVQQTAWAFNRPDAFGDMLFFKFTIINKGGVDITESFVSFWADVDIGDAADLVGSDTTLSLGYNYKTQPDGLYGPAAPAIGYDFFQGPIVASPGDTALVSGRKVPGFKNLPLTSFAKYINGGPPQYSDPETGPEAYNFMLGLDKLGNPIINTVTNEVTKFWHTGDPVTNTGWLDISHADKRFLMSTGPFTLAAGDTQEVVGGMVIAQGSDAPSTVQLLKLADQSAQAAYDNNFLLPKSPPSPAATVSPEKDAIFLQWDNKAEAYNEIDNFHVDDEGNPSYYTFQGYNVYQTDELTIGASTTVAKIATYDIIDGITEIRDLDFIESINQSAEIVVQKGSDSGVQRFIRITQDATRGNEPLVPNRRYYFTVTSYGYNPLGAPKTLESTLSTFVAIPQSPPLGTELTGVVGDTLPYTRVSGGSDGFITPIIVDRNALNGHEYEVRFRNTASGTVYDVWDLSTTPSPTRVDSNRTNQSDASGPSDYPIVGGVMIKVTGAPQDFADFLTVANAAGPLNPPEYGAFAFNSSGFPHPTTADRPAPRQQSTVTLGSQGWGFHTGAGGIAGDFTYSRFLIRVARNDNFDRIIPYDYELRFTAAGGKADMAFTTGSIVDVPFEIWNIGLGTPNDASDDFRMIPLINDIDRNELYNLAKSDHPISGGDNDPETDWIYFYEPLNKTPGSAGYNEFVATGEAAIGDEVMARLVLVFWNGGSVADPTFPANCPLPLPETGTVFRILTTKPNTPADKFKFATPAPVENNTALAQQQATLVNVFPNPYAGFNIEEVDPVNRFVTFTHLTPTAKIRIFTISGELVRTLNHSDGTQFERWDLRNASDVPVASGIYICHVELPGVGQKVLKLAVFQPEERLDVF